MKRVLAYLVVSLVLVTAGVLVSAQIDLTTFTPDTPILAQEVNTNFQNLATAIEELRNLPTVQSLNTLAGDLTLVAGDNIALDIDDTTGEIVITSTAQGTAGGDITRVTAGTGLAGGGQSGDVTLRIGNSYRLPQACANGSIPEWDGTAWVCGLDDVGSGGGGGDITAVTAGTGLSGGGESGSVTLGVVFGGSGSSAQAARVDHDHLGQSWSGTDSPLILEGNHSFEPFVAEEQKGAPLVLTNTDPLGYGLRITEAGHNGVVVDSAGSDGVQVRSADGEGVQVNSARNGFYVVSADNDGFHVDSAGGNGVDVVTAVDDGLFVDSAGDDGVHVWSAGGDGVFVDSAADDGIQIGSAGDHGVLVSSAGDDGIQVGSAGGDGVDARSISASGYGGRFRNTATGGVGLYALGGGNDAFDLVLGGSSSVDDDGRIASDPSHTGSDLYLVSNDAVVIGLDQNDDETGEFLVRDSLGSNILDLTESGNMTIAGTLTENSDRHAKIDITPVEPGVILEALARVPVSTWRYRDSPEALHVGPMAQDFHAAFGVGGTDTGMSAIDRDGVAFAAIQGLHALVLERNALIEEQSSRLAEQETRLLAQESRLVALESRLLALEEMLAQPAHSSVPTSGR